MPDTNLSDDMLKLVRFKILFVKRDYEVAFPEQEELVSDNMTETAYTAWKIAEFIQHLKRTESPEKWKDKNYPRKFSEDERKRRNVYIDDLPESDKKYLRVYFQVLDRYVREKLKYEERHLEVLEQIRDKMPATAVAENK